MKTGIWQHKYRINPENNFGFIYIIKNNLTCKKYIGKKQYHNYKKKKLWKKSNWETYTSSSKEVNKDIIEFGIENFHFEILIETVTRGWLTYLECKLQYDYNVLTERDEYGERTWYNAVINAIKFVPAEQWSEENKIKVALIIKKMWKLGAYKDRDFSGLNNPMFGRKHKKETLLLFSQQRKGVVQTKEHIAKRVAKTTGQKRTLEFREAQRQKMLGVKKPTHTCKKCGKTMAIHNAKRYGHFTEKCK